MPGKYSVAICPPTEVIKQIKSMKDELAKATGNYPSRNSAAHITIAEIETDDEGLKRLELFISRFCKTQRSFTVKLTKTGSYANGAFYMAPDEASAADLKELMKSFHTSSKAFSWTIQSKDPHMTIGRQLKPPQLAKAAELWSVNPPKISFVCDGICIRVFEPARKQYGLYKQFEFGNEGRMEQMKIPF